MGLPLGRFHHVGFVVADMEAGVKSFTERLSLDWNGKVFSDPHQKVNVTFLGSPVQGGLIELVQPAGADSPVAKFLNNGGGLHHVCYEVENVERDLAVLRANGNYIMKQPKPAVAFGGRLIAWILTPERLLVEILEQENVNG